MNARVAFILMGIMAASLIGLSAYFLWKGQPTAIIAEGIQPSNVDAKQPTGEGSLRVLPELENAQIDDKAGARIPLDIRLVDHDGNERTLGSYLLDDDKRPLIVTLGYYGCPMLCTLVLNGLSEVLKSVSFTPGKDYHIVSVSIDDREKPELAKQKRSAYLASMNADESVDWWSFHVTTKEDAKRLADALGFNFYFDKKIDQFAHGAGFFVLSPEGILSRTLFGISYLPGDVKLALSEAADGKIGSFIDRVLLSCFHYDPDSHRYGVYIFGVMRLGGILTVLILGAVLLFYFRQEKRRMRALT